MENATLMVGSDARRWTRDQLAAIDTPPRTKTWLPVPHHDLVTGICAELIGRGIAIADEQYCTVGKRDERLLGVLDLRIPALDRPDFHLGLALKAGNDMKTQVRLLAAARVSACSNQMISGSGDAVCLKRKHTSGFDLAELVPRAIESFLQKAGKFEREIETLQEILLSDERAKALLFDAFGHNRSVAPLFLLPKVARLYFDSDEQRGMFPERSAWSLNNAFTQAFKSLRPTSQFQCGQNLGRFFSTVVVNGQRMQAQLELPLALEGEQPEPESQPELEPEPEPTPYDDEPYPMGGGFY